MENGICPKCSSTEVYFSDAANAFNGLSNNPFLRIYKENKWIPDIELLEFNYYLCRSCGHFEMKIRELDRLAKLDDCTNWRKIDRTQ